MPEKQQLTRQQTISLQSEPRFNVAEPTPQQYTYSKAGRQKGTGEYLPYKVERDSSGNITKITYYKNYMHRIRDYKTEYYKNGQLYKTENIARNRKGRRTKKTTTNYETGEVQTKKITGKATKRNIETYKATKEAQFEKQIKATPTLSGRRLYEYPQELTEVKDKEGKFVGYLINGEIVKEEEKKLTSKTKDFINETSKSYAEQLKHFFVSALKGAGKLTSARNLGKLDPNNALKIIEKYNYQDNWDEWIPPTGTKIFNEKDRKIINQKLKELDQATTYERGKEGIKDEDVQNFLIAVGLAGASATGIGSFLVKWGFRGLAGKQILDMQSGKIEISPENVAEALIYATPDAIKGLRAIGKLARRVPYSIKPTDVPKEFSREVEAYRRAYEKLYYTKRPIRDIQWNRIESIKGNQKAINTARDFLSTNERAVVGGTVSLETGGVDIPRIPQDFDIYDARNNPKQLSEMFQNKLKDSNVRFTTDGTDIIINGKKVFTFHKMDVLTSTLKTVIEPFRLPSFARYETPEGIKIADPNLIAMRKLEGGFERNLERYTKDIPAGVEAVKQFLEQEISKSYNKPLILSQVKQYLSGQGLEWLYPYLEKGAKERATPIPDFYTGEKPKVGAGLKYVEPTGIGLTTVEGKPVDVGKYKEMIYDGKEWRVREPYDVYPIATRYPEVTSPYQDPIYPWMKSVRDSLYMQYPDAPEITYPYPEETIEEPPYYPDEGEGETPPPPPYEPPESPDTPYYTATGTPPERIITSDEKVSKETKKAKKLKYQDQENQIAYTPVFKYKGKNILSRKYLQTKKGAISEGMIITDQTPITSFVVKQKIVPKKDIRKARRYNQANKFTKNRNAFVERRYYRFDKKPERSSYFNIFPYVFGNTNN